MHLNVYPALSTIESGFPGQENTDRKQRHLIQPVYKAAVTSFAIALPNSDLSRNSIHRHKTP